MGWMSDITTDHHLESISKVRKQFIDNKQKELNVVGLNAVDRAKAESYIQAIEDFTEEIRKHITY